MDAASSLPCTTHRTRFRRLACALSQLQSQHDRQHGQLGALYSLVRLTFFGVARSGRIRLSLFAEIPPPFGARCSLASSYSYSITISSAKPPSKRPTSLFQPRSISSILPKRVFTLCTSLDGILLIFLFRPLLSLDAVTTFLTNPMWIVKSVGIHHAAKLAYRTQRSLEYVSSLAMFRPLSIRMLRCSARYTVMRVGASSIVTQRSR